MLSMVISGIVLILAFQGWSIVSNYMKTAKAASEKHNEVLRSAISKWEVE